MRGILNRNEKMQSLAIPMLAIFQNNCHRAEDIQKYDIILNKFKQKCTHLV